MADHGAQAVEARCCFFNTRRAADTADSTQISEVDGSNSPTDQALESTLPVAGAALTLRHSLRCAVKWVGSIVT